MANTSVKGKIIALKAPSYLLFNAFSDMTNLVRNMPEEKRKDIEATPDTIEGKVNGLSMGLKIIERRPYNSIIFEQFGNSPINFNIIMFFDSIDSQNTDFHIELNAELNFLMKSMIGGKLQEMVDQITDQLAAAFQGQMPDNAAPDLSKYN